MKRETIKQLAAEIKATWPELDVLVERGYANTDRKIRGTRLSHPGKGRYGSRIIVSTARRPGLGLDTWRPGILLLDHNNAETYRRVSEVREWIERYADKHGRG